MATQTKRARTGFSGEFTIYAELLLREKNCFITLGNAKSVDLIIIDKNKKAYFVDVKSTSTLMKNSHKHNNYNETDGKIGRWQLTMKQFWETHKNNTKSKNQSFADFYIFCNINNLKKTYILTGKELEALAHDRIDKLLTAKGITELPSKDFGVWGYCEFCFDTQCLNSWGKLPK